MPEETLTERLARIKRGWLIDDAPRAALSGDSTARDVEWLVRTVETLYRQNCEYMALVKQGADKLEAAEYAREKEKTEGQAMAREVLRLKENEERRRIDDELARSELDGDRGVSGVGGDGGEAAAGGNPEHVAGRGSSLV